MQRHVSIDIVDNVAFDVVANVTICLLSVSRYCQVNTYRCLFDGEMRWSSFVAQHVR